MATGRAARLLAVASVALGACGESQAGVPWRLFGLVSPPAGFVGHCQDSLRHVRAPQLLCRSSAGPAEWSVRLDSAGRALLLARSERVGPGRAGAIVDSLRAYLEPRLGPGEICPVGLGHTWYRDGWNTFVVVQGSDFTAAGDTLVSVLVAAARGPQDTPC